jgi:hypothetical protein
MSPFNIRSIILLEIYTVMTLDKHKLIRLEFST